MRDIVMENPVEACLGAVYTMDHEVVPRKRPILRSGISLGENRRTTCDKK
jgi:hypothetical protein